MEQKDPKNTKNDQNVGEIYDASLKKHHIVGGKPMRDAINKVAQAAQNQDGKTACEQWTIAMDSPQPEGAQSQDTDR